ncbi:polymer-forming cytoskeletal protein [Stigmatella sp. ncwal1]|uniref:Polymer-forming cytoskeletal protein n=1 Tax=Stigmatella ashevillensis TaxID=2995309 RepID=A0ABT5D214_9BACT|nr:polymer-forming cytoskeletal protein [Stigmatella ashevillena]MDC0707692.1 polymer-forming cytoskeletal protein [Stigmatella ashevillena]
MRPLSFAPLALATLLAFPAFADDTGKKKPSGPRVICAVQSKDGTRAVQGTDLVLEAGETLKDAVAVEGNVIVRKGAVVEDVVAIQGKVIVEAGAEVKGNVVALGGDIRLRKNAHVQGDAVALGGSINADEEATIDGDKVNFSLAFNGKELVRSFLKNALDEESGCTISFDDEGDKT